MSEYRHVMTWDTPRTNEQAFDVGGGSCVDADWARELEREIAQYKKALEESQKREAMSLACVESRKQDEGADAKRMEWVLENIWNMDSPLDILSSREAIDYAMKEWKS